MTSSERSYLGLAKQVASGTPNTTDADFMYVMYLQGGGNVNNVIRPLDKEVGGGALPRGAIKAGVVSGAAAEIIPRPASLGHFLTGALGDVDSTDDADGSYTHIFTLPTDQFDAPYYTIRNAPGNMWGEQYQDARVSTLSLRWRGADFVRGSVGFLAGLPTPVSTAAWAVPTYLDSGPQFLAPLGDIELPTGTDIKVLEGSFISALNIPLEEQWIVGSYSPDDMDIVSRMFSISLRIKVTDDTLYEAMSYDPAAAGAWLPEIYKEGRLGLSFDSDIEAATGVPYSITIDANDETGATANLDWSVQPLSMRAGGIVTMIATASFNASSVEAEPITVTMVNTTDETTY